MRSVAAVAVVAGVLLLLPGMLESWTWGRSQLFVRPVAHLSAFLLGCPAVPSGAGTWLLSPPLGNALEVSPACSGTGFFCLLLGLVAWHTLRGPVGRRGLVVAAGIYPLALCLNACRVSASALVGWGGDTLLGPHYHDIVHMTLGVLVFLPVLYVLHLVLIHESHRSCPAITPGHDLRP